MNSSRMTYTPSLFRKTVENISLLEKTGVLEIKDTTSEKHSKSFFLYITNGEIIYIKESPADSDNRIGNVLIKRKYLSESQLSETLSLQKNNEYEFLGDILLKQGFITPNELLETLTYQIENMIFQIAFITEGEISFNEGEIPQRMPQIPYTITLSSLLLIFISSCDLKKKHPFLDGTFSQSFKAVPGKNRADLNPMEGEIIDLFSGRMNIRGVFDAMPFHNHASVLRTILSLHDRDMLDKGSFPSPPPEQPRPETIHPAPVQGPSMTEINKTVEQAMAKIHSAETAPKREIKIPKKKKTEKKRSAHTVRPKTVSANDTRIRTKPRETVKPAFSRPVEATTHSPSTYIIAKAFSFTLVFLLLSLYASILHPILSVNLVRHTVFTTRSFDETSRIEYTKEVLNLIKSGDDSYKTDGWGNPIEIRGRRVISPGPDGIIDTGDDISR